MNVFIVFSSSNINVSVRFCITLRWVPIAIKVVITNFCNIFPKNHNVWFTSVGEFFAGVVVLFNRVFI
ncbi:MAG: hypothetical protein EBV19_07915 [Flavobacteriia bacterium]|nr:hypothetical protein [Flavobacteriia bacterium]